MSDRLGRPSLQGNGSGIGGLPATGEVEDGGGEGETDEDIDEIVVAQVDGGEPESDAGDGIETETPLPVPAVEEKHVGGNGTVEAGKNVDAVAAVPDHGGVPVSEDVAGDRHAEFVRHGKVRASGGNEGVAKKADAVDGEETEVEALEQRKRVEEIFEHAESEIGNEEHVAKAEGFGEERADMRLEAKAKIFADEGAVDAAKGGVEERTMMDNGDDLGHEFVGEVHDDGIVEEAETPGPVGRNAGGEIDQESGGEEEGKIEKREGVGEARAVDESEPGNDKESLEEVLVRE